MAQWRGRLGTSGPGLEIMVYLGILDTRKFIGSQKILTELTAILLRIRNNYACHYKKCCCVQGYNSKRLCSRVYILIFLWKCQIPLLDRKCSAISIILTFIICMVHRKFINSWSLFFLLSFKVTSQRKFSAIQSDSFL